MRPPPPETRPGRMPYIVDDVIDDDDDDDDKDDDNVLSVPMTVALMLIGKF